jgi:arylsulfatase A-like enzyme
MSPIELQIMPDLRQLERAASQILPEQAKDVLGRVYNRGRTFRANRKYNPVATDRIPKEGSPQHVIIVVVDALRYDYISKQTAPFLSSKNPIEAIAPSTWTFPSVSSLLTGQYPHEHGAIRQTDDPDNATEKEIEIPVLASEKRTLPEVLGGAGITTYGGFGFGMPFLALKSRFHKHRLYRDANAEKLLAYHQSWIGSRGNQRTFSYIHLSDLHTPHHPPGEYAADFDVDLSIHKINSWRYTDETESTPDADRYQEHKRRLYQSSLRYVDDTISAYYDELKSRFGSDLLVFITSDHGEGFWEHTSFDTEHFYDSRPAYCVGHGGTPYECITRVPLWADEIEMRTGELTSLVDITPTILETLGLDNELAVTGTALCQPKDENRLILTEGARYGYERKAIYRNDWKIIKSLGDETCVTFKIETEPTETVIPPAVKSEMLDAFPPWPDGQTRATNRVSGTVEQRLRDLGYQ